MAEKKTLPKTPEKPSRKGKASPQKGIDPKAEGRNLFMLGHHSQAQIAALLGVTENTVGRWKKEGNWEVIRAAHLSGKDEVERMLLDQVHQIAADAAKSGRPMNLKETMSIVNLSNAIDRLKVVSMTAVVQTGIGFTTWVDENHPEEAKKVVDMWNDFLTAQFQRK